MRKQKSTRLDPPWIQYIKQHTRHYIETVFRDLQENKIPVKLGQW